MKWSPRVKEGGAPAAFGLGEPQVHMKHKAECCVLLYQTAQ